MHALHALGCDAVPRARARAACSRASRSASCPTRRPELAPPRPRPWRRRREARPHGPDGAVVTGASRGIGRAIAVALARGRAPPSRSSRRRLESVGAPWRRAIRARAARRRRSRATSRAPTSVQAAGRGRRRSRSGGVDIVVNNAGITRDGLVMRMSEADWDAVLDTNLKGAFHVVKAFSRPLLRVEARPRHQRRLGGRHRRQRRAGQLRREQGRASSRSRSRSRRSSARAAITVNALAPGLRRDGHDGVAPGRAAGRHGQGHPPRAGGHACGRRRGRGLPARRISGSYVTGQVLAIDGGLRL